ncbi:unnamed protein product [Paramecium pentaurelia]|uniref:Transmembrane protein n=1 Tax=Paramecium pentaurelia TaxID=43138 RepID=A0A8S1XBT3_9CILI|nr:unnamed protein product [Paramecium pentaurelia]
MIQNLAIALCITMAISITLNLNEMCHCSQLIEENDCTKSALQCSWDFGSQKCQENPCSDITYSTSCLQQSWRCFWVNGLCQDFTDCQNLKGSSQSSCINQNIYCPASNGTNCQSIDNLQNCTSITTRDNCNNYYSAEGLCIWNGQNCILPTSCSQLSNSIYPTCDLNECTYNKDTYQCLPRTCQEYQDEIKCSQGVLVFGPYLNNVIGCFWNYQSQSCQEYDPFSMNDQNCYNSSFGTYHWKKEKHQEGECISCYQQLLILSIIITMLI